MDDTVALTGPLLKAARALLGITSGALAKEARVGDVTVKRAEASPGLVSLSPVTAAALIAAYKRMGVTFIIEGNRQGVLVERH